MKGFAILCTTILIISTVLFGISFAATGYNEADWGGDTMTTAFDQTFTEKFDKINIAVVSAKTTIKTAPGDATSIVYSSNRTNVDFSAKIENGRLVVKEDFRWNIFFNFGTYSSVLEITVPEEMYDKIDIVTVSGGMDIDGLQGSEFALSTTSGKVTAAVYGEEMEISTISGNVALENITNKQVKKLVVNATSGDTSVSGYSTEEFKLSSVSGGTKAYGISGKGKVNMTSGDVVLEYAEWNEALEISSVSGSVNVTLPAGSGVNLDLSRISGRVKYNLDGEEGTQSSSGTASFGGGNRQEVRVSLTSGTVEFRN